MIDGIELIAIGDAEGAEIIGGGPDLLTIVIVYALNNAGAFLQGVKDGYAAGSPR
jgi:hypothetical protein